MESDTCLTHRTNEWTIRTLTDCLMHCHSRVLIVCQATTPRAAMLGERVGMALPERADPPRSDILLTAAAVTSPPEPASLPDMTELSESILIEQVLARNPSLAQMVAVWRAAAA